MKILVATGIFPPDHGGPATYVPGFARWSVAAGHSVRVVAYGSVRTGDFPYPVVSVPRLPLPFRHAAFFIACLRHGFSSDVIFAQDAFSSGFPAACAAFLLRKPFALKIVGDFSWEYSRNAGISDDGIDAFQRRVSYPPITSLMRFLERSVCRFSRRIIVPSNYLKTLVSGWGVDSAKIEVIRNAVSASASPHVVSRDPFLVFSAGRFVPWKHFDGLIRAFTLASADYPDTRLVIAGDGPSFPAIRALASSLPASSRISLIGSLSPEEMSSWYSRAGCFALFSEYEGLSHVLLEAVAHRTPVIASDVGGNPELITHGDTGFLVPRGDEPALARALVSFFAHPWPDPPPSARHCFTPDDSFHAACESLKRVSLMP